MEIQYLCELLSKYSQDYANETLIPVKVLLKEIILAIYKQMNSVIDNLFNEVENKPLFNLIK